MTPSPKSADAAFTARTRTLLYASDVALIGASVIAALAITSTSGGHWEWGPFIASLLVTAVGVACIEGLRRGMIARAKPTPEQLTRMQERRRIRSGPVNAAYASMAIAFGLFSGAIPSYWPVVGLAVLILLFGIMLPGLILAVVWRRVSRSRRNEMPS